MYLHLSSFTLFTRDFRGDVTRTVHLKGQAIIFDSYTPWCTWIAQSQPNWWRRVVRAGLCRLVQELASLYLLISHKKPTFRSSLHILHTTLPTWLHSLRLRRLECLCRGTVQKA